MGRITELVLVMFTVVLSLPGTKPQLRPKMPKLPPKIKPVELATCDKEMLEAGIDFFFAKSIAHRAHSLTSEDVQYYFKSDGTDHVNIPTVNSDLSVEGLARVLPYAPKDGYDTKFATIAMRHTDKVLSKMDNEKWGVKYYSVLEKLVHEHHMAELWRNAQTYYNKFKRRGVRKELCGCLTDTSNNGIYAELQLLALKIKYPGITSGNFDLDSFKSKRWGYRLSYSLSYRLSYSLYVLARNQNDPAEHEKLMQYREKLRHFDFSGNDAKVVKRVARELIDGDEGLSTGLTDEKGWDEWKKGFHNMREDKASDRTFGMFMYCMLNGGQ